MDSRIGTKNSPAPSRRRRNTGETQSAPPRVNSEPEDVPYARRACRGDVSTASRRSPGPLCPDAFVKHGTRNIRAEFETKSLFQTSLGDRMQLQACNLSPSQTLLRMLFWCLHNTYIIFCA